MVSVNFPDAGGEALPRVPASPPLPQSQPQPQPPEPAVVGFPSKSPEPAPKEQRREAEPLELRSSDPKDREMLNKLMEGLGNRLETESIFRI